MIVNKSDYLKQWRTSKKQDGFCNRCGNAPAVFNRNSCADCLEKGKAKTKEARLRKLLDGKCIKPGCDKPHEHGKQSCKEHLEAEVKRNMAVREARRNAGGCYDCGGEPIEGKDRCEKCYLKQTARERLGSMKLWKELRSLFEKQSVCPYTGKQLVLGKTASLDHILPTSRGGTNEIGNLQWVYSEGGSAAVFDVNRMKGAMTDEEFRTTVKAMADRL